MFCIGHSNWLADSQFGSTFFLFNSKIKEVECICIAQVIKKQRLYHVYFDLLKNIDDIVFEHKNEYKIVVPVI